MGTLDSPQCPIMAENREQPGVHTAKLEGQEAIESVLNNEQCGNTDCAQTLRQIAASCCKHIDIGAAVLPKPLLGDSYLQVYGSDQSASAEFDPRYSHVLKSEFNAIVIEHHLKWSPLCEDLPGPINDGAPSNRFGRYDFAHVDATVDWALSHNMKVKGHVLCWHVTSPSFLSDDKMAGENVREELRRHIYTTVGHFRGRIHMWDVVNEALAPDGTLAHNIFLRKLGPTYIDDCFNWAHDADPDAFLIYNGGFVMRRLLEGLPKK